MMYTPTRTRMVSISEVKASVGNLPLHINILVHTKRKL